MPSDGRAPVMAERTNAQIDYLLRCALAEANRLPT